MVSDQWTDRFPKAVLPYLERALETRAVINDYPDAGHYVKTQSRVCERLEDLSKETLWEALIDAASEGFICAGCGTRQLYEPYTRNDLDALSYCVPCFGKGYPGT